MGIRHKLRLPTRDAYQDAAFIAFVLLMFACLFFMIVALVTSAFIMAVWVIIAAIVSLLFVFGVAFIIENRK